MRLLKRTVAGCEDGCVVAAAYYYYYYYYY